mmetsp:Transcript_40019/g.89752  ORF Transcript_40019/g.89752 Transcript_40019/m.89752 type:complete len:747 (+) Transcript_40019:71-2311(+)
MIYSPRQPVYEPRPGSPLRSGRTTDVVQSVDALQVPVSMTPNNQNRSFAEVFADITSVGLKKSQSLHGSMSVSAPAGSIPQPSIHQAQAACCQGVQSPRAPRRSCGSVSLSRYRSYSPPAPAARRTSLVCPPGGWHSLQGCSRASISAPSGCRSPSIAASVAVQAPNLVRSSAGSLLVRPPEPFKTPPAPVLVRAPDRTRSTSAHAAYSMLHAPERARSPAAAAAAAGSIVVQPPERARSPSAQVIARAAAGARSPRASGRSRVVRGPDLRCASGSAVVALAPGLEALRSPRAPAASAPVPFWQPRIAPRSVSWSSVSLGQLLSESGGTSDVYRGVLDGTPVAVKRLRRDPTASQNFKKELDVLQRLTHRNIVELKAFIQEEPFALVLELVTFPREYAAHFQTFYEFMWQARRCEGGVTSRARWAWTQQLLQAIAYVHSRQVLHLDVKTKNLMLDEDGCLKLMDFGCAQIVDYSMQIALHTQGVTGTPRYLPPEALQVPIVARDKTDVYSLGCCLVELLGGPVAFEHLVSHEEVLAALRRGERPLVSVDKAFDNVEVNRLVSRAIASSWIERPTSAALLQEALGIAEPYPGSFSQAKQASAPSMSSNSCAAPVAAPTAGGAATPTFASRVGTATPRKAAALVAAAPKTLSVVPPQPAPAASPTLVAGAAKPMTVKLPSQRMNQRLLPSSPAEIAPTPYLPARAATFPVCPVSDAASKSNPVTPAWSYRGSIVRATPQASQRSLLVR